MKMESLRNEIKESLATAFAKSPDDNFCGHSVAIVDAMIKALPGMAGVFLTAFKAGYEAGHDAGYVEGQKDTYDSDEYTSGHEDGYNEGFQEGETLGYEEGYVSGMEAVTAQPKPHQ